MKIYYFITCLLLLSMQSVIAQDYSMYGEEGVFMYTQPNAKAEAMGGGMATTYGSPFSATYNPAASSLVTGLNIEASHFNPYLIGDNRPHYEAYGISYNTQKYGAIAFNASHYSEGSEMQRTIRDSSGYGYKTLYTYTPNQTLYTFNYSYNYNDFCIGVNLDYYENQFFQKNNSTFFVDLGMLKKLDFSSNKNKQSVLFGISLTNISKTKLEMKTDAVAQSGKSEYSLGKYSIPSFLRAGASYEFQTGAKVADLNLFKMTYSINYRNVVNLDNTYALQLGSEFSFFEILQLRIGYLWDKSSQNLTESYSDKYSDLTYGAGILFPISRLYNIKYPIEFHLDYSLISDFAQSGSFNLNPKNILSGSLKIGI
jgi:hypothetical protein